MIKKAFEDEPTSETQIKFWYQHLAGELLKAVYALECLQNVKYTKTLNEFRLQSKEIALWLKYLNKS